MTEEIFPEDDGLTQDEPVKSSSKKKKKSADWFFIVDQSGTIHKVRKVERDYRLNVARGWREATAEEIEGFGS